MGTTIRELERRAEKGDSNAAVRAFVQKMRLDGHTSDCAAVIAGTDFVFAHTQWQETVNAWMARWPDFCVTCEGWGGWHIGDGEYEFCEDCVAIQCCPRCSKNLRLCRTPATDSFYWRCPFCSWVERLTAGIPEPPMDFTECDCGRGWD